MDHEGARLTVLPLSTKNEEGPASQPRRALIIANPTAGGFRRDFLDCFAARLRARGVRTELMLTQHAGHLTALAETLDANIDTLIIGGGDGSINEAVTGLLRRAAPPPALAILPFGTGNVLARELKLPFRPQPLADMVAARRLVLTYPGLADARPFMLMVSAGFDGAVVHNIKPRQKRLFGRLAYALTALSLAFSHRHEDFNVDVDGRVIPCRLAIVTTARFYGGPYGLTRHTHVTQPGLRVITLGDDRPLVLAKVFAFLALNRLHRVKGVRDESASMVRFLGKVPPMQIDGDALNAPPALVRSGSRPLPVIIAAGVSFTP